MEVISKGKYISISPKKAREVADLIRGKNARQAKEMLKLMSKGAAGLIEKVLSSAMANAENNFNLEKDELKISKITIDGGPTLKRYRPRAKGVASSIKKRTSHITVIVSGDVKTKQPAEAKIPQQVSAAQEKVAATGDKAKQGVQKIEKTSETDEHKIEIEKPEFVKKEHNAPRFEIKNKFFRRKTG